MKTRSGGRSHNARADDLGLVFDSDPRHDHASRPAPTPATDTELQD